MTTLTDEGALNLLLMEVGQATNAGALMLRLFANDIVPGRDTALSDFVAASGAIEDAINISRGWRIRVNDVPMLEHDAVKFTFTRPAGKVHGYYMTRGTLLTRCKRFDEPFDILREGDSIEITPRLSISDSKMKG